MCGGARYYSGLGLFSDVLLIYRAFAGLAILLVPLCFSVRSVRIWPLLLLLFLFFITCLQWLLGGGSIAFSDLRFVYKVTLPFLALGGALWYLDYEPRGVEKMRSIIVVNAFVLILNQLLSFFNIGYSNYGPENAAELVTGTGFLYAGNEVSGLLITLYCLTLLLFRNSFWTSIALIFLFGLASVTLGTKSSIVSHFLVTLWFVLLLRRSLQILILGIVPVLVLLPGQSFSALVSALGPMLSRWQHFSETYGFWPVLFGGVKRLGNIEAQLEEILASPWQSIIGRGWSGVAENGAVDLFYAYGVFGLLVFGFWLCIGPITIVGRLGSPRVAVRWFVGMSLTLVGIAALLAGHFVQSASISIFWALLVCAGVRGKEQLCVRPR